MFAIRNHRRPPGRMRSSAIAAALVGISAAGVSAAPPDATPSTSAAAEFDPATVRMANVPSATVDWCFLVAQDQGFFSDYAIDIGEPLVVESSTDLIRAMLAGEADLGLGNFEILNTDFGGDLPVRFIAATGKALSALVGRTDGGTGIESLGGATVAFGLESNPSTLIGEGILRDQLGEGNYDPLYIGGGSSARLAALTSGQADAAVLIPPALEVALESDDSIEVIFSFADYEEFALGSQGTVIANDGWLEDNVDVAARWLAADIEGCRWLYDEANRERAIAILADVGDHRNSRSVIIESRGSAGLFLPAGDVSCASFRAWCRWWRW